MKQKGYVMTWDAILALFFIILVFIGLITLEYSRTINVKKTGFLKLHSTSEDALDILNKMGILGSIVAYWSENNTEMANETATFYLEWIIPENIGYRLKVGNDIICVNLRIREDEASDKTKSTRMVTGYAKNKSQEFIARAWLLYNETSTNKSYSIANVSYGRGLRDAEGCEWLIEYMNITLDNENTTILIPPDYPGDSKCNYTSTDYLEEPEGEDAVNDAIYRLINKSDIDDNGVMDQIDGMSFNETSMTFKTANITTKSLTDTAEVTLVVWMR